MIILIPTTKERRGRLQECLDSIRNGSVIPQIMINENHKQGYVKAVFDMLEKLNPETSVWILGDDNTVERDTVLFLFKRMLGDNDKIFQPYEDIHKGELPVCPAGRVKTLLKYMHPGYFHNFVDTEMMMKAKARDSYVIVKEAVVSHNHWVNGRAEKDETYKINTDTYIKDKELFEKRQANGFI